MNRFVPLLIVVFLVVLFAAMMGGDRNPQELKSVLIGKEAPAFDLESVIEGQEGLSNTALATGDPIIVNFFASWCVPCRAEHENLMKLAETYKVPVYGIAYKDKVTASRAFLEELGNPYVQTGADLSGIVGIDFGVTGVPETFVIDGDGVIRYRHWGPVIGTAVEDKILPELEKAR
ncbi:thiol:disulfide interchange protein DsbE [Kordiimonas sediminis]|uniref:Thiol:disulfide interchange protein DsbE n=1 Tax=Kordiimonas sediminis TaxID=1735581 RepID=A0A919E316_9PROT|nr:DsbE family thiol:disulfide interchange protein [Kordiimonas sediminis]GHF14383.1 thiol:disulfide interchange protein DsbE [Kordiimonas sediminis]